MMRTSVRNTRSYRFFANDRIKVNRLLCFSATDYRHFFTEMKKKILLFQLRVLIHKEKDAFVSSEQNHEIE